MDQLDEREVTSGIPDFKDRAVLIGISVHLNKNIKSSRLNLRKLSITNSVKLWLPQLLLVF